MRIAICPGSFDPVTYGHLDIIERSAEMVDELIVAVFCNPTKHPMCSMEERVDMLKHTTKHLANVKIDSFGGLLSDYAKQKNCHLLIRGLRAFSDFEYEFQRALLLKQINPELETAFFMTQGKYSFLSSTGVRELAHFGGNISKLVPPYVEKIMREKNLGIEK